MLCFFCLLCLLIKEVLILSLQIQPIKSCELDAMLAENRQQMKKMTLDDDDLDSETKDLFVVVDNPEKHTTTMESYMTFRVTTKVSAWSH